MAAALILAGCITTGTKHAEKNADADDYTRTTDARGPEAIAAAAQAQAPPPPLYVKAPDRLTYTQPTLSVKETYRGRHTDTDKTTPPPTIGQRISAIVGTFGGLGIVAVILLAVFAPSVLAAWFAKSLIAWRSAMRQTVAAIDASNAVTAHPPLALALNSTQDATTRKLVDKLQGE